MTGTIDFYADEARTQPITQSQLAAVSQGADELFFTRFMPAPVFFTANWKGPESGDLTLTVGIFKRVAGSEQFCVSEDVPASVERASNASWPGSVQIRDLPWGPGEYLFRVWHEDTRLAEGILSLVD